MIKDYNMNKRIKFEDWIEVYNPIVTNDDELKDFDLYREELKNYDNNVIWTEINGENETIYILPGIHIVNKSRIFVTETPWKDKDIEIDLNDYISIEDALMNSEKFIDTILNKDFDRTLLENYIRADSNNKEITIGETKYKLMDFLEDELNINIAVFEDQIHDYFSQLI